MLGRNLEQLRLCAPIIHCITNYVTVNDVANILLACGGSPIMADDLAEVEEITALCQGLTINIGTLSQRTIPAMLAAGKTANRLGIPVILDPVGAGASALRTQTALTLLNEIRFAVIRGNSSELKTLATGSGTTRGVDADLADAVTAENLERRVDFIKSMSAQTGAVVAITGAIDLVADQAQCYVISNGRPEMGQITGTGCQLSALTCAFVAANPDTPLQAAAAAISCMGVAGELGWEQMAPTDGNATYRNHIIDAVYHMDGAQLDRRATYELR